MSRKAIFISAKTAYLEKVGVFAGKSIDFWKGYNQNGKLYQDSRNIYSQILINGDEEFYLYAIQCCDNDKEGGPHYRNNGGYYIKAITSFLKEESDKIGAFDQVYLFLHEKDINCADYLTNTIKNHNCFSDTLLPYIFKVTEEGKRLYSNFELDFCMLLFQHEIHCPIFDFITVPVSLNSINELFQKLSNRRCL